jgi:hypothetical protein
MATRPGEASESVRDTVRALQVDRVATEVVGALTSSGVQTLLLKGAGTATLLYTGGPGRNYADVDLLVERGRLPAAGAALRALGYELEEDDTAWSAADRVNPHSQTWKRPADEIDVDLHFTLPGARVSDERVWRTMLAGSQPLDLGDGVVTVPAPAARLVHVAVHVWQHRGRHDRALRDLRRALEVADRSTWQAAADFAIELDAGDAFAAGLSADPRGAALAGELGLADAEPLTRLWMTEPSPGSIALARLLHAPGLRARLSVARELVVPPRIVLERHFGRPLPTRRAYASAAVRRLAAAPRIARSAVASYRTARRTKDTS